VQKNPTVECESAAADSTPERDSVMKITRIAALAAFLAMPLLAQGQSAMAKNDKAAQEVIDFRNRYIEAEENRDMAFLDKILADDFFALNPQGKLLNKTQQLENLKRPERTLKVLNARETHVQFYANGDVAILTEHVTVDGHDNGKPFGGEYRFLRVFAKQNGNWKVVLAQGSPMPEQPAAAK
jgi:ketosteroid isomerase-like protein